MEKAKPFVKWAGGKGNLISQLDAQLPSQLHEIEEFTYIEPFVGGGAMLFHMLQKYKNIKRVIINDINKDLIRCYQLIKNNPEQLISRLKDIEKEYFEVSEEARDDVYYAFRDSFNKSNLHKDQRAAIFIFLNHTCYNGLYRENSKGKFNVPTGRYKRPQICNEDLIRIDSELMNSVEFEILNGSYKKVCEKLIQDEYSFLYLDPPYRPLSQTSYFNEYTKSPFGDKQQEELKHFCDKLNNIGSQWMLSNSDSRNDDGSSYFEKLYQEYELTRVLAPRFINANAEKRRKLSEVLITNY